MNEEEKVRVEMESRIDNKTIRVSGENWGCVLEQIGRGEAKVKIAEIDGCYFVRQDSGRRLIKIPESEGQIKRRLALSLLFHHPERLSRPELSLSSSVSSGSLGNYLTKENLEILPHIDENTEGIVLREKSITWARKMLSNEI